jgi:transketolase
VRNRFATTLHTLAREDPRLVVLVADISPAGAMDDFRREFPGRFINVGVAEQVMIGMAAGLALSGLRPFCYTIAPFALYRPFEFIRDDLAYQNLPVTVVGIGGGVSYSTLGPTHHTVEDVAIASSVPNLTVLAPCDPYEVEEATQWCARNEWGPVYMRLGRVGEPDLGDFWSDQWSFGTLRWLERGPGSGTDVCVLSYGPAISWALEHAGRLREAGLRVDVASVHTLKPLDVITILRVLGSYREVTIVEEAVYQGGLGMQVRALAHEAGSVCTVRVVCLRDEFTHLYGTREDVLAWHGWNTMLTRHGLEV